MDYMLDRRNQLMKWLFLYAKSFYVSVLLVCVNISISSQNSLNDLNILFKHNFENNTLGDYQITEWREDWLYPGWHNRQEETDIVRDENDLVNQTKTLQLNYPANSLGPHEGGTNWTTNFARSDEVYLSYDVLFMPGFEYNIGGKLPGLLAGDGEGTKVNGYDSFAPILMFGPDGQLEFYYFYVDMPNVYGESLIWGYPYGTGTVRNNVTVNFSSGDHPHMTPGLWNNITFRAVANTITDGVADYNGIMEGFFNGKLVIQVSGIRWRLTEDLKMDQLRFQTFFGGSSDIWRNPIDEWIRIDNVMIYTFKEGVNVPRGNTLSSTNRTINYWRNITNGVTVGQVPSAPSQLIHEDYTESSITLKWKDNSNNESGFIITRSQVLDPSNVTTLTVGANDTCYTDNELTPNTTYIYSIQAVNSVGISKTSNKNIAATLSVAEAKRIKDGLVAYYNFGYDPQNLIRDISGYLTPLNLKILPTSSVSWNESNRLSINSNATLISDLPATKIVSALKKTNELTIEVWIKPNEQYSSSDSRILSIGNNDSDIGFVLEQYYDYSEEKHINYGSRLQTESTNYSGYPLLLPKNDNLYLNMQHITYVRDSLGKELLYINGSKVAEGFRPGSLNTWKDNYYIRLGNEADQIHSWKGTFYVVAIYDRALNYREISNNYRAMPCDSLTTNGMNYLINVYPNPAFNKTNIEIVPERVLDIAPSTYIRMQDVSGRIYLQEYIFNPNSPYFKELDLTHLHSGVYFVQVISGNNYKTAKLIIL